MFTDDTPALFTRADTADRIAERMSERPDVRYASKAARVVRGEMRGYRIRVKASDGRTYLVSNDMADRLTQ